MKHRTILFMRNSVSVGVGLFIGSIIILLGAESLFPGTLYTDAEAAAVEEAAPTLSLPIIIGGVSTSSAPETVVAEAPKQSTTRAVSKKTAAASTMTARIAATVASEPVQSAPPAPAATPTHLAQPLTPSRISIPSVGISSPVIGVGTNAKGEMDVPDGTTNNVGWYKHGVKPGAVGTAVFDAHVYAAFENLGKTQVGDSITVSAADGTTLHYRVTRVATYKLDSLSPTTLFAESSTRDINLITCAGTFVKSIGTYDHRTIVSATLVQ